MPSRAERGPVFVVGAPRSGTRLLAWSLGQHAAMQTVLDAGWVGSFTPELVGAYHRATVPSERSQAVLAGTSREGFLRAFGPPIEQALGFGNGGGESDGPRGRAGVAKVRWVDGTPENALHVYGLSRVFPSALFVHVVRDVEEVVGSLTALATPDGAYYTEESATEAWLRLVRAAVRAEGALGPERMLRLGHRGLADDPERALRRVLGFLDEPFDDACLRPLRGLSSDASDARGVGVAIRNRSNDSRTMREAIALSRELLAGAGPPEPAAEPDARPDPSELSAELSDELDARGTAASGGGGEPRSPLDRIRAIVRAAVPEGATLLVVSRGDDELVRIPQRRAWHFPRAANGVYAGHHPADDRAAIAHLEELRDRGADYLLLPCTSFWWLEHYTGFRAHLETRSRLVAYHEDSCLLFALRRDPAGAGVRLRIPTDA